MYKGYKGLNPRFDGAFLIQENCATMCYYLSS